MKRKTKLWVFALVVFSSCLFSCRNNQDDKTAELQAQIDSLETVNTSLLEKQKETSDFLGIIMESIDSIAEQENYIRMISKGVEGRRLSMAEQKQRLKEFAELLERQRNRIAQLEDSLANKGEGFEKLSRLINYLNQQLDEKNRQINALQKQIASGRIQVQNLIEKVDSLTSSNNALAEAVVVQNDIINEGYFIIGSKKELKAAGVLTGGGLSRKKLNASNFANAGFTKVDIANFTEITINSSKIEILTSMPKGSYQIVPSGDQCKLIIIDPTSFWSVSNYLVIQTK